MLEKTNDHAALVAFSELAFYEFHNTIYINRLCNLNGQCGVILNSRPQSPLFRLKRYLYFITPII